MGTALTTKSNIIMKLKNLSSKKLILAHQFFIYDAALIILGLAYILITALAADHYFKETTQRLNAHVAT